MEDNLDWKGLAGRMCDQLCEGVDGTEGVDSCGADAEEFDDGANSLIAEFYRMHRRATILQSE